MLGDRFFPDRFVLAVLADNDRAVIQRVHTQIGRVFQNPRKSARVVAMSVREHQRVKIGQPITQRIKRRDNVLIDVKGGRGAIHERNSAVTFYNEHRRVKIFKRHPQPKNTVNFSVKSVHFSLSPKNIFSYIIQL
jgi:hypothetical protein